jgi:hypothetical protein
MARRDLLLPDAHASDTEDREPSHELIRPCLRRAFPLPENGHETDARFCRLLDALAQCGAEKH